MGVLSLTDLLCTATVPVFLQRATDPHEVPLRKAIQSWFSNNHPQVASDARVEQIPPGAKIAWQSADGVQTPVVAKLIITWWLRTQEQAREEEEKATAARRARGGGGSAQDTRLGMDPQSKPPVPKLPPSPEPESIPSTEDDFEGLPIPQEVRLPPLPAHLRR